MKIKDFIIAVAIGFGMYVVGGFVIGFIGALLGIKGLPADLIVLILTIAAPVFYAMKKVGNK